MDQSRFDDLTRRLGAGISRRAGLRAALGGLLGTGIAALAPVPKIEAKRKRKKKRNTCLQPNQPCSDNSHCCGMCRAGACCAGFDQPCVESRDCCNQNTCLGGHCVAAFE